MSQESMKIIRYIKSLSITNGGYEAVLNRLKIMPADKAERFLSKFHGMSLADFMMAVEGG